MGGVGEYQLLGRVGGGEVSLSKSSTLVAR